jgi:hypothetical protein
MEPPAKNACHQGDDHMIDRRNSPYNVGRGAPAHNPPAYARNGDGQQARFGGHRLRRAVSRTHEAQKA